jgi:uncharacterized protein (TIGR02145 family)
MIITAILSRRLVNHLVIFILIGILVQNHPIKAQTIVPEPTVTILLSAQKSPIFQKFEISWKCTDPSATLPESQLQTRYKLDVPGEWMAGIKYNINKWTDYRDGAEDHVIYDDFILEGTYKISVQCKNKMTGKTTKVISKSFTLYWEYPEIQEEAFNIDFEKASNASSEKEKYLILADEYKKSYILWNQKFEYETQAMHSTISKEELIQKFVGAIGEDLTQEAMLSLLTKSGQKIASKLLTPLQVYELMKLGTIDIILIYRRYKADKALIMAAVSYKAWKFLEGYSSLLSSSNVSQNSFKDHRDGKVYKTVKIGNQVWMAENLAFNCGNGCWPYNNDHSNVKVYGYLYNWEMAKKACPSGWHLPTDAEWMDLEKFLGMSQVIVEEGNYRGNDEGSKLAGDSSLWRDGGLESDPNFGSCGFNALPGGMYHGYGIKYDGLGNWGSWWSSTAHNADIAIYRHLEHHCSNIYRGAYHNNRGYSVRCLKN